MEIIVNGRVKVYTKEYIGVSDVSILAFGYDVTFSKPDIVLTITYSTPNAKGSLYHSKKIKVEDGMIFNVALTTKS